VVKRSAHHLLYPYNNPTSHHCIRHFQTLDRETHQQSLPTYRLKPPLLSQGGGKERCFLTIRDQLSIHGKYCHLTGTEVK
jgi:hypothetical protein